MARFGWLWVVTLVVFTDPLGYAQEQDHSESLETVEQIRSCLDAAKQAKPSGVFEIAIDPSSNSTVKTYCDNTYKGGGWTRVAYEPASDKSGLKLLGADTENPEDIAGGTGRGIIGARLRGRYNQVLIRSGKFTMQFSTSEDIFGDTKKIEIPIDNVQTSDKSKGSTTADISITSAGQLMLCRAAVDGKPLTSGSPWGVMPRGGRDPECGCSVLDGSIPGFFYPGSQSQCEGCICSSEALPADLEILVRGDVAPRPCEAGPWSLFSECSKECGGGIKERSRNVTKPAVRGGPACGALVERQSCRTQQCPIDCKYSSWTPFGGCSKPCGHGSATRHRVVMQPSEHGGVNCGQLSQDRACNTHSCNPAFADGISAKDWVDCKLSEWSPLSQCSRECGGGTQLQSRKIEAHPVGSGQSCGVLSRGLSCNTQPCPQHCLLTQWSNYATCTAPCGTGTQQRTRAIQLPPLSGGIPCGELLQHRQCNTQACPPIPVSCVVSDWSKWSDCNGECDTAMRLRTREVERPAADGGTACPALIDHKHCRPATCTPIAHGNWWFDDEHADQQWTRFGDAQLQHGRLTFTHGFATAVVPAWKHMVPAVNKEPGSLELWVQLASVPACCGGTLGLQVAMSNASRSLVLCLAPGGVWVGGYADTDVPVTLETNEKQMPPRVSLATGMLLPHENFGWSQLIAVYRESEQVQLFLNGEEFGQQPKDQELEQASTYQPVRYKVQNMSVIAGIIPQKVVPWQIICEEATNTTLQGSLRHVVAYDGALSDEDPSNVYEITTQEMTERKAQAEAKQAAKLKLLTEIKQEHEKKVEVAMAKLVEEEQKRHVVDEEIAKAAEVVDNAAEQRAEATREANNFTSNLIDVEDLMKVQAGRAQKEQVQAAESAATRLAALKADPGQWSQLKATGFTKGFLEEQLSATDCRQRCVKQPTCQGFSIVLPPDGGSSCLLPVPDGRTAVGSVEHSTHFEVASSWSEIPQTAVLQNYDTLEVGLAECKHACLARTSCEGFSATSSGCRVPREGSVLATGVFRGSSFYSPGLPRKALNQEQQLAEQLHVMETQSIEKLELKQSSLTKQAKRALKREGVTEGSVATATEELESFSGDKQRVDAAVTEEQQAVADCTAQLNTAAANAAVVQKEIADRKNLEAQDIANEAKVKLAHNVKLAEEQRFETMDAQFSFDAVDVTFSEAWKEYEVLLSKLKAGHKVRAFMLPPTQKRCPSGMAFDGHFQHEQLVQSNWSSVRLCLGVVDLSTLEGLGFLVPNDDPALCHGNSGGWLNASTLTNSVAKQAAWFGATVCAGKKGKMPQHYGYLSPSHGCREGFRRKAGFDPKVLVRGGSWQSVTEGAVCYGASPAADESEQETELEEAFRNSTAVIAKTRPQLNLARQTLATENHKLEIALKKAGMWEAEQGKKAEIAAAALAAKMQADVVAGQASEQMVLAKSLEGNSVDQLSTAEVDQEKTAKQEQDQSQQTEKSAREVSTMAQTRLEEAANDAKEASVNLEFAKQREETAARDYWELLAEQNNMTEKACHLSWDQV